MIEEVKKAAVRYKELILYGFSGIAATMVNILGFCLCRKAMGMRLITSNILAWMSAFIVAFITNKMWVFESKEWRSLTAAREMVQFLIVRFGTFFLDTFFIWLLVERMLVHELFAKIGINIVVIAINFIAGKFWIFKREEGIKKG